MRVRRQLDPIVGRLLRRALATLCVCAVAACGSTTVSDTNPSSARCGSSLTGLPASVGAGGGQFTATVATPRECAWTAESDSSWIQITPASGQGETAVTLAVVANPAGIARSAFLTVNGARTSVRQDASTCRVTFDTSSVNVSASGGTVAVAVSAASGCTWQVATSASWLRATRADGIGIGSAEFVADASDGTERMATLRVGDASMTVTQTAAGTPPPPAPTTSSLVATYTGAASGTHNFDASGALSLGPGTYAMTFNQAGTIYVRGVAGGGGGGGGRRRDDGGSSTAGGGGGGGGAASLAGQSIEVVAGTIYEAIVGMGGAGGAGATEAAGNTAGSGAQGGLTAFRVRGGTTYLHLNGGAGGTGGGNASGPGGAGGSAAFGPGVTGGGGGNGGGDFGTVAPQTGAGTSGVNTGGGGGGGYSREQSSNAGGAAGAPGGAAGGAGGSGARGGNAGNGATDSGAGGEGARDGNGDDSAGGGGGGGRGISVSGGPANRGGGGGGGGAINTANSTDRGGSGGAGGAGGMSIGIR